MIRYGNPNKHMTLSSSINSSCVWLSYTAYRMCDGIFYTLSVTHTELSALVTIHGTRHGVRYFENSRADLWIIAFLLLHFYWNSIFDCISVVSSAAKAEIEYRGSCHFVVAPIITICGRDIVPPNHC